VQTRIRVRWNDLDAFGHVNNAVFLTYLEEGRDRVVESVLTDTINDFVLAHIGVDYRHELGAADEEVTVDCAIVGYGRSSVRTHERILMQDGTLAAEAESVLVAIDTRSRESRPLTETETKSLAAAIAAAAD
jgi:acyl-CoA thioester hydrolase